MRALQDVMMWVGGALASFALLVLFPIGCRPARFVGVSALHEARMCTTGERTFACGEYDSVLEDKLNCTSLELQQAGFAMTRFTSSQRAGRLHFVRGEDEGVASITRETNGYRFEFITDPFSRPHADVDKARAFATSALAAMGKSCGELSEPQEICENAECPGEPPTHHEMTIAYIVDHVAASARYILRR